MTYMTQKHETSTPIPIPRTGISGAPHILLHIILCLTSAMIPIGVAGLFGATRLPPLALEIISFFVLIMIGLYFFRTGKLSGKKSVSMLPIMLFGTVLLFYMTGSALLPAICFSVIFFIGEGGMLLAVQPKNALLAFPLVPLIAFGLSLSVCKGLDTALLCLLPLPATIAMAWGTRSSAAKTTGLTRIGVICLTSLFLGITTFCFLVWFVYKAVGTLEIAELQRILDNIRTETILRISEFKIVSGEEVTYPFEGKETLVENAVTVTFNLIPAFFVIVCNITATLSQMVTLSGLVAFGFGDSVTGRVKAYRISTVSSFVFILAWVVAFIANASTSTLVGTVAENFAIMLLPGMALAGFLRFTQTLMKKGCAPGCLIFVLIMVLSVNAIFILACYEAIAAVFGPWIAKLKPPKNDDDNIFPPKQDNNPDNNDSNDSNDNNQDNNGPRLF